MAAEPSEEQYALTGTHPQTDKPVPGLRLIQ